MTQAEFLKNAFELFNNGTITEEEYDTLIINMQDFINEDED